MPQSVDFNFLYKCTHQKTKNSLQRSKLIDVGNYFGNPNPTHYGKRKVNE